MGDWLLPVAGLLALPWTLRVVRKRWRGDFDEERMVRQGVPRHYVTAFSSIVPTTPLFCVIAVLSAEWVVDPRVGFVAFVFLSPLYLVLGCSLFFFMFPRFLVPPPIRHRQSLASRALRGPRTTDEADR